jgi:hypothetical protein
MSARGWWWCRNEIALALCNIIVAGASALVSTGEEERSVIDGEQHKSEPIGLALDPWRNCYHPHVLTVPVRSHPHGVWFAPDWMATIRPRNYGLGPHHSCIWGCSPQNALAACLKHKWPAARSPMNTNPPGSAAGLTLPAYAWRRASGSRPPRRARRRASSRRGRAATCGSSPARPGPPPPSGGR